MSEKKATSVLLHIELLEPVPKSKKAYLFSNSDERSRLCAYVKNNSLFFGIPDLPYLPKDNIQKDSYFYKIPIKEYFNKRILLSFEYSSNEQSENLSILINNNKIKEHKLNRKVSSEEEAITHLYTSIGSGLDDNENCGFFNLHDFLIFGRILEKEEHQKTYQYFMDKDAFQAGGYRGKQFMFKDQSSRGLMQPDKKKQPKVVGNDK